MQQTHATTGDLPGLDIAADSWKLVVDLTLESIAQPISMMGLRDHFVELRRHKGGSELLHSSLISHYIHFLAPPDPLHHYFLIGKCSGCGYRSAYSP